MNLHNLFKVFIVLAYSTASLGTKLTHGNDEGHDRDLIVKSTRVIGGDIVRLLDIFCFF